MSKIICDVCGTSYQETATQCPICGCVRPSDVVVVNSDTDENLSHKSGTYTHVKGGRFSKANVKKRNLGNPVTPAETSVQIDEPERGKGKSDKGLIIAVCALLLAIIAVVVYIALHFFAPGALGGEDSTSGSAESTVSTTGENTQDTTLEATVIEIPCVDIVVSKTVVEFEKAGAALLLNVTTNPGNTTDPVVFISSDEAVATVSDAGKIEAVGPGQAVITITCGNATAECRVQCDFEDESAETTEATEATVAVTDFELNRSDFTLSKKGETWKLYNGEIPVKQITWTSDNEKVVTIKDGVVTAVGKGNTTVHAEYNGIKRSCRVICAASVGAYVQETQTESDQEATGSYSISSTDVTLRLNGSNSFELKLLDANKQAIDVIWTVADEGVCTVSGDTVTGVAVGDTTVSATYEGKTYTCTVRVRS